MVNYQDTGAAFPLLGTSFAMLLYGVVLMQTYIYSQNYRNDSGFIKLVHYFIAHFANFRALRKIEWSLVLVAAIGMIIGWIANLFFVWRIWLLSRKNLIPLISTMLATIRAVLGIYVCYLGFPYNTWDAFLPKAYSFVLAGLVIEVTVNSVITVAVSYELLQGRSGVPQTDAIINRLLIYTVNTGAITSFVAIAEMVTFLALNNTVIFLAFVFVQSKLYANCLLATLNARKAMRARSGLGLGSTLKRDSTLQSTKLREPPRTFDRHIAHHGIEVCTETIVKTDGSPRFNMTHGYPFNPEKEPSLIMTV